jgi:hypothetical protein
MSKGQKAVIFGGLMVMLLMLIYPPWIYTYEGQSPPMEQWASYYWFFLLPQHHGMKLHIPLLLLQWSVVAGGVVALVFILRSKVRQERRSD